MPLSLRARPVSRRIDGDMVPAYDIYQGTMAIPEYTVVHRGRAWEVLPVAGPYGVMYEQKRIASEITGRVAFTVAFQLRDVLAEVRCVLEAWERELAAEAAAELETERRAEAFWENRMSDEDRAREDWEYCMYGA